MDSTINIKRTPIEGDIKCLADSHEHPRRKLVVDNRGGKNRALSRCEARRHSGFLCGGPGNDRLNGGNGPNILVGCEGDDELIGGLLNDLLIGGDGADRLNGGHGDDILVAANIVDPITLTEDVKYSDLVVALNGGPIIVDDDGDVDKLTGAAGTDTFYYHYLGNLPLDIVTDKAEVAFNT